MKLKNSTTALGIFFLVLGVFNLFVFIFSLISKLSSQNFANFELVCLVIGYLISLAVITFCVIDCFLIKSNKFNIKFIFASFLSSLFWIVTVFFKDIIIIFEQGINLGGTFNLIAFLLVETALIIIYSLYIVAFKFENFSKKALYVLPIILLLTLFFFAIINVAGFSMASLVDWDKIFIIISLTTPAIFNIIFYDIIISNK